MAGRPNPCAGSYCHKLLQVCGAVLATALTAPSNLQALSAEAQPALAMYGKPALPADFSAPRYANPTAPKGGRLVQGVLGTFDSLNPFIVRGVALTGIRSPFTANNNVISGYVVESLMARSFDEPFTLYGLLARAIETDEARSYITFILDPKARFSDGKPVTAQDVLFTWQLLRDKGRPNHRLFYSKVKKAEALDDKTVRFDLGDNTDRELPLILGLMPVLPQHAVNRETFEDTSFVAPIGSGPYRVTDVKPGSSVTFTRNPDYWGRDLPINRGLWNFDEIRFDYYRDANAHLEAFRKGLYDIRAETDAGKWRNGYDGPALRDGRIVKDSFPTGMPKGMFAFVFNTRRAIFQDLRVREAIALLFDFKWLNHNVFFDLYRRTGSFFEGSELSFRGHPADDRERALLAAFPGAVRADVMNGTWTPPESDGSGRDRNALKRALALLNQAGYELRGADLVEKTSGRPFAFEILVANKDDEKLALLFAGQIRRAGITANIRVADAVQFEARRLNFDYDMVPARWDQSLSPGNEQAYYWSSAAADADGSRNYMGVKNPALDAMIAALLRAENREQVVSAIRAIDRILISGFYVVPLFHMPEQWVARWARIRRPEKVSVAGYLPETWWHQAGKE